MLLYLSISDLYFSCSRDEIWEEDSSYTKSSESGFDPTI